VYLYFTLKGATSIFMKNKIFLLLLTTLLLTGCGQNTSTPAKDSNNSSVPNNITSESPDSKPQAPYVVTFESTTIDDEIITDDIFANSKLTMLNVWATYCNPCLNEMPDLGEIATEYDTADFQICGIICDVTPDSPSSDLVDAQELIEATKATTYPHILLNESLYYNLVGASDSVPTTYFINQKSELVGYLIGAQSKENWITIIDSLLSETGE
jgi:thiol-disulfide isomerase/thioredoxin